MLPVQIHTLQPEPMDFEYLQEYVSTDCVTLPAPGTEIPSGGSKIPQSWERRARCGIPYRRCGGNTQCHCWSRAGAVPAASGEGSRRRGSPSPRRPGDRGSSPPPRFTPDWQESDSRGVFKSILMLGRHQATLSAALKVISDTDIREKFAGVQHNLFLQRVVSGEG